MTNDIDLLNKISDIIWNDAEINNEYGEDLYVRNSDALAEKILTLIQGNKYTPKAVDPDKMDEIGRNIGLVKNGELI